MNPHSIGVLDSGLGGLSVLKALRRRLPHESFLYYADCAHAPWGDRSAEYIFARCTAMIDAMRAQNIKALVLACNTATAMAADALRSRYVNIPIIGIEPAVKPAAIASKTGVVGVLATTRTITSERYRTLVARWGNDVRVLSQAAPGLMECVERGEFSAPSTLALLKHYLEPMMDAHADTLVLGCTHYPFLIDAINAVTKGSMRILEPGDAVAAVTEQRLIHLNATAPETQTGQESFFISDSEQHAPILTHLWPNALSPALEMQV